MKYQNNTHIFNPLLFILCIGLTGCEDYLEVDLPNNRLNSETVFNDQGSAESAVQGVYNELSRSYFADGGANSVTVLAGLSADNLVTIINTQNLQQFEQNEISVQNSDNYELWSSAYNIIYQSNAVIEGLQTTTSLPQKEVDQMIGEMKFIRAFVHFYLVNLYGEIPLVLSPDYRINANITRSSVEMVYAQIIEDLETSVELMGNTGVSTNRLRANTLTVKAFLARVYLYQNNWEAAERLSTEVIQSVPLELEEEPNEVFLANSTEAIWQISPVNTGSGALHTREGNFFIIDLPPSSSNPVGLSPQLLALFSAGDKRKQQWINSYIGEENTFYYPFKYKVAYAISGEATEYSMVLRLAEQWLIRAESRAQRSNITGAIADLDQIRERSNIGSIADLAPDISPNVLLDSIRLERRRELFTEWGHRWFDLKRQDKANEVLAPQKPLWESTDILYPIAEEEKNKNPKLGQNPGY